MRHASLTARRVSKCGFRPGAGPSHELTPLLLACRLFPTLQSTPASPFSAPQSSHHSPSHPLQHLHQAPPSQHQLPAHPSMSFLPSNPFPSQTPASTPHHSPLRSQIPLPLPPSCQQQSDLFRPPQHLQPDHPLAHSAQFAASSGPRPLQPPPSKPASGGYTMGPRADCEKCRLGVRGHWGHWADGRGMSH